MRVLLSLLQTVSTITQLVEPTLEIALSILAQDLVKAHFCHSSISLATCHPSGCTVVYGVVGVVHNCSQMRTSKCTCLIFGVSIGLDPG